jgi:peptide/nickel transport system permease protein
LGFSRYLLRRLGYALIVLFVIMSFNFAIFRLMPGDATKMIIDPMFTPEAIAELKRQFGLDDPPLVQYFKYVGNLFKFDLGLSFSTRRPVVNELKERLPNTAVLFLASFTLTTIIGISVGVYTASRRGTFGDNFVTGAGLFTYAVPTFWIQLLLLMLFGYYIPILPIHGTMSAPPPDGFLLQFLDRIHHLILPAGSNVIVAFGSWALYTRNTMLEAAKELGARRVSVLADSELVVRQMQGAYAVKSPRLRPLFMKARRLRDEFARFDIKHIQREKNARADMLANLGIDSGLDKPD